jgi:DNA-binding transcriptional LysR family regulator
MRMTQLRQADLNLLVVFVVFAEERNVSRAAERLLLSQPAVSRALQRLRDTFHDDLFVRTAAGYEPTPQGERLLQELEVMLPRLDRLLSGAAFDPSLEEATFRIGSTDSSASTLAPIICRKILPTATKVRFEFIQWHKGLFDELTHGSVDLMFTASVVEAPSPLQSQMVYDEEFVCVVDAKSPYKNRLTIRQYIEAKHVTVNIQRGIQVAPDKHLATLGYKRQVALQVPYHETAIRCVEGTKFIATVARRFIEGMGLTPAIRVLKAPPEVGGFRYMMVWHPRLNTDAAHTWLRATMRNIGTLISEPKRKL